VETPTDTTYVPLAPLPRLGDKECIVTDSKGTQTTVKCFETQINKETNPCPFGKYMNIMINLVIGLIAVGAVVMIVMGGIEYMTSELISSKQAGRERIVNALLGLLIAVGAYVLLNTINPQLLDMCLELEAVEITIKPEEILRNRAGGGVCAPITDPNNLCYPANLTAAFPGAPGNPAPFNTLAAQASAICSLESHGMPDISSGADRCADKKAFSFGLFQINGSAHRDAIPACNGAFSIPPGHERSQGNRINNGLSWTCTTVEPAYTRCKNYLLNPVNNIAFASRLKRANTWYPTWSTYNSCQGKF
jgi:hypothetical protein